MKTRCIVLAVLLLVPALASCKADAKPEESQPSPETTAYYADGVDGSTVSEEVIPTFNSAPFTTLHYDSTYSRYYFTADQTGEVLSDSAYKRNLEVEETYDVVLKEAAGASNKCANELKSAVLAGDGTYDCVIPHSGEGYTGLITANVVCNLRTIDALKLDSDYWYAQALDALTIGGKTYFAPSYYTVACQNFFCLVYNKQMITDNSLPSPMTFVNDGTWTLDRMREMMDTVTVDLNGDGKMDQNDCYGLVTCTNIMYPFQGGFGLIAVDKNEKGVPELVINSDRTVDMVEKMNALMSSGSVFFGTYSNQQYITQDFGTSHALFALFGMGTYYQTLRQIENFDYGILPLPKLDALQEKYYSLRADSYIGVPSVVNDISKTGVVLDALSEKSEEYVYPAFRENVLYAKCLQDEDSYKVVDLIYDGFLCDIGMTYCSSKTLPRLLDQYKSTNTIGFASLYAANHAGIEKELDNLFNYITSDGVEGATSIQVSLNAAVAADNMTQLSPEKTVISRTDSFMEGWPDLIKLQSGKLLCVYNECVGHGNRDHTHITLRESTDDGKTWSEKRYIDIETNQGDQWNSIRISQLSDGRIILVCDRIDYKETTDTTEIWMWESDDDGVTWSEGIRHGIFGYCADKVRELKDGTLLLLVSSYNSEMKRSVVYAHRSADGGKTWSQRINAAVDSRYNLIEPACLELSDGTLVAFLRENSSKNYNCMKVISTDSGLTWSEVCECPIPGMHRAAVGYLSDGRILLSYRSYLNKTKRVTGAAVFDEATAKAVSLENQTVKLYQVDYDRASAPDTGYTAWVELNGGTILMANYIVDDAPKAYIRGCFFQMADLK